MPERYSRLEVGPVGQAARSIASGAAASIPEHEGLKNLQAPDEYAVLHLVAAGCNPHCNPVHPVPWGSRCFTTPKLKTAWHQSGMRARPCPCVYRRGSSSSSTRSIVTTAQGSPAA